MVTRLGVLCALLLSGCSWALPDIPCTSADQCGTGQSCQGGTCKEGQGCAAPNTLCGSACVNLSTDQNNCGTCGTSCGTHGCNSGACTVQRFTLMVTTTGSGNVTSTPAGINCPGQCGVLYDVGTVLTLTAAPNGSTFAGWTGACSGTGGCSVTLNADTTVGAKFTAPGASSKTLSVTISGTGSGTVTSSPSGISCNTGTCTASFGTGTSVTLSASPNPGSLFSSFSGDCGGTTCNLTMSTDLSITGTFTTATAATNKLSVTVTGGGSVSSLPAGITNCTATSGTCSASFTTGTAITLTQTADSTSVFTGWGGMPCSGTGACSFTLSNDISTSAAFAHAPLLSVTQTGAGRVVSAPAGIDCPTTCSARFTQLSTITLTETPASNSVFTGFGGACSGTSCQVMNLTADTTVTATFSRMYTLTVNQIGQGYISSTPSGLSCNGPTGPCTAQFSSGTSIELDASSNSTGFVFTGFGGDCASGTGPCTLTMNSDHTVSAGFGGFTVTSPAASPFSLLQGESRTLEVDVPLASGSAPISAALSIGQLPAGVTASFSPTNVAAGGHSTLTVTAASDAPLLSNDSGHPITGTSTGTLPTLTQSISLQLAVRSTGALTGPYGVAIEPGDTTALVSEPGASRISRVDLATKQVIKTIADVNKVLGLVVESGGTTALAAAEILGVGSLVRIDLTTGAVTIINSTLVGPDHVALLNSGTALVTDCGNSSTCLTGSDGRLMSVALLSGVATQIANGFSSPRGVAIEAGGAKALVVENTTGRLMEVNLTSGGLLPVATGLLSPNGVVIEPGGASAIVSEAFGRMTRVTLATGTLSSFANLFGGSSDIALRTDGTTLLALNNGAVGSLVGINTTFPVTTIAPSRQSSTVLQMPQGVVAEAGGTTALVTDCGGTTCSGSTGRLLRVTLANGAVTPIVSTGLQEPHAIAVVGDGTVLLTERTGNRLTRVNLANGTFSSPITGLTDPWGVAIESSTSVLIAQTAGIVVRGNLTTAATSPIGTVLGGGAYAHDIVIPNGGTSALVASSSYPSGLFSVPLVAGSSITDLSPGLSDPFGLALESGGTSAIVTENTSSRISRVDLASGNSTVLGFFGALGYIGRAPLGVSIEPSGTSALVVLAGLNNAGGNDGNVLVRVTFGTTYTPRTIARGLEYGSQQALLQPEGAPVAIEASGTVLYADCNGTRPFCGRLMRTSVSGGTPTVLATGYNAIGGIAALDANTALVTDCGSTAKSCTSGRLWSVPLNGTTATPIIPSGLNVPLAVVVEPASGSPPTTALLAEQGTSRVLRVTLGDGSSIAVGASLSYVTQVAVESSGLTAIVAANGELKRINLTTHAVTTLVPNWNARTFAIEKGGATALVAGAGNGLNAELARVNLTTGGVDILRGGFFTGAGSMVFDLAADSTGKTLIYSEPKTNLRGAIYTLGL